jgi:hypothetical protein
VLSTLKDFVLGLSHSLTMSQFTKQFCSSQSNFTGLHCSKLLESKCQPLTKHFCLCFPVLAISNSTATSMALLKTNLVMLRPCLKLFNGSQLTPWAWQIRLIRTWHIFPGFPFTILKFFLLSGNISLSCFVQNARLAQASEPFLQVFLFQKHSLSFSSSMSS